MAKKDVSHIIMDLKSGDYICNNCGATYTPQKNFVPLSIFCAVVNAFLKDHRRCKPKKSEKYEKNGGVKS